jgi:hypothetical protein
VVLSRAVDTGRSGAQPSEGWSVASATEQPTGGTPQSKLEQLTTSPAGVRRVGASGIERYVSRINTYDLQPEYQPGPITRVDTLPDFSQKARVMRHRTVVSSRLGKSETRSLILANSVISGLWSESRFTNLPKKVVYFLSSEPMISDRSLTFPPSNSSNQTCLRSLQ